MKLMSKQRGLLKASLISLSLERSLELQHLGLAQELSKVIRDACFFQLCALLYLGRGPTPHVPKWLQNLHPLYLKGSRKGERWRESGKETFIPLLLKKKSSPLSFLFSTPPFKDTSQKFLRGVCFVLFCFAYI